ncbi:MAG: hypothetical protein COS42_12405 [Flavobacteriales bacterium CG03_land_8_20_14_0_80_35_15]|nr:hypothetical protein [Zetaproteobacteria bacterium]OIO09497.1 MAG: hypothetical protein AUJ53_09085 [Flavobacteriaceae bacterium CG1_02_35_72]PIV15994.1 MAG: hypothetical protein COS42_12405 [Flavobacteriales bacterium CG03_land_8_20_14_0_80_35_15]
MKILVMLSVFVLITTSCTETKRIIVHSCSNNIEANADILRSLELNTNDLKENNIEIKMDNEKCGYTLIYNNKEKFIEGGMTDIDLMLEIKSFYKLK